MNKEARIESQIKHFYANMPDVDDSFPLKEHLLKHEDSRMAWYLLGKSYEGKGDLSKATYCFAQAGDIYTAFEGKPAPSLAQYASPENGRRSTLGWTVVIGLLLVGIGFGLYALAEKNNKPTADQVTYGVSSVQSATASPTARGAYTMVSAATDPDAAGQKVLSDLLAANQPAGLLVEAPTLGKWQDWLKSGVPIAEVVQDRLNGTAQINWFQADWCRCVPQEHKAVEKKVVPWKQAQEEKLVLRSAIVRYREQTGKWPQTPEALSGDYPNNWLSGWNPEMTGWFEELTAEAERQAQEKPQNDNSQPTDVGWPDQADEGKNSGATPAGLYEQFQHEPLEIVVDKSKHRLAVVSGNIIVRSYQVGLGGERTPSGRMLITEKVKNPNGGQDVYGSRGMTLSDEQYGIHGTPKIGSIGKDESLGCVRMTNDDIEELYALVPLGTPVTFVDSGLPAEQRTPEEPFQLKPMANEENPEKTYQWLM